MSDPFPSTAPGAVDVVLRRALGPAATCLEIGTGEATRALRESGWTGTVVRDVGELPGSGPGSLDVLVLSDVSLLPQVLASGSARPKVLVVGTAPGAARTAMDGYRLVLHNGVQDVLLQQDSGDLAAALSYPAGDLDSFTTARERALAEEVATWRARALSSWQEQAAAGPASGGITDLLAMRQSISWRVTRPLRSVRSRLPGAGG